MPAHSGSSPGRRLPVVADAETARIYEREAREWIAQRGPRAVEDGRLDRFAAQLPAGSRIADLGCGPGWYASAFAERGLWSIALDLSAAMLKEVPAALPRVRASLLELPFRNRSLDAAWAPACYQHLPLSSLPLALAHLQRALRVDARIELTLARMPDGATQQELEAAEAERRQHTGAHAGRLFSHHSPERIARLLEGAGFCEPEIAELPGGFWLSVSARRAHTLPDFVGPGLRLLVCGLNPSLGSAEAGIPFAHPGNRFWRAAQHAGLVERDRDPLDALSRGIGFTDLAKRATARAAELEDAEYRAGRERVEGLVRRLKPRAVCFVGLGGWRASIDPRAGPGWVQGGFGGVPGYLMPSTSGLNAASRPEELARHLARAARGP